MPLDVTWQVFFTTAELKRLRRARSHLVQTVCDAIEVWAPIHASFFGEVRSFDPQTVCFLHDPLALTVAFDPSFVFEAAWNARHGRAFRRW